MTPRRGPDGRFLPNIRPTTSPEPTRQRPKAGPSAYLWTAIALLVVAGIVVAAIMDGA